MDKILEVKNLDIFFKKGIFLKKNEMILKNINFSLKVSENLGIVAPSGRGKTTLIKTICKIHNSFSGEIKICNKNINEYKNSEFFKLVSLTFQDPKSSFNPYLSVKEAILEGNNNLEILKFLDEFKIDKNENVTKLSGGEAARVAILRALAKEPKLIFLDEINSSLDLINQAKLIKFIKKFEKISFVIISHDEFFLKKLSDKIIKI